MRLTLRTMLAYIDDILEPKDAEIIAKKIEESEFATKLLHRTREAMRRLRLGAPNVADRGAGLDPNTVAEYLDNTLDDARVPDFEKVCLESDIHLAEVASCHQILALVLGEPAEVDPVGRQRMYHLPEVIAAQTKKEALGPPKLPEPVPGDGDHREKRADHRRPGESAVPEYLRPGDGKWRFWQAIAGAVALLLVAVIVLLVAGQFEPGTPLGRLLGLGEGIELASDRPEQKQEGAQETAAAGPGLPAAAEPKSDQKAAVVDKPVERPEAAPAAAPGATAAAVQPAAPAGPGDDRSSAKPEFDAGNPLRPPVPAAPLRQPGAEALSKPTTADQPAKPASPAAAPSSAVGGAAPAPSAANAEGPFAGPEVAAKPGGPGPAEPASVSRQSVGRFLSASGVLLTLDGGSQTWQRVAPDGVLASQDRLLSLPVYRPAVLLAGQIRLELIDGTRLDLQPVDAEGVPGVSVDHGRLKIRPEWKEKSRIRLQVGSRIGVITFGDAQTEVAIQVSRARTPGVDPETQPPPRSADVYVYSGKISWRETADREVAVNAPVRFALNDKPLEAVAVQQAPKWIAADTASPLDQSAAAQMERELQDRPIALALREMVDSHRRIEVRRLAGRSLACLGDYELIVAALNNPERKQNWPEYVEQLQEGVARSPESAGAIRSALRNLYESDGALLYELLWRYPEDRLSAQEAAALIAYLDHGALAVRVLSFWGNLKPVTGLLLFYRPEEAEGKRKVSVARWRERLKAGWPAAGSAVREREPRPSAGESSAPAKPVRENTDE